MKTKKISPKYKMMKKMKNFNNNKKKKISQNNNYKIPDPIVMNTESINNLLKISTKAKIKPQKELVKILNFILYLLFPQIKDKIIILKKTLKITPIPEIIIILYLLLTLKKACFKPIHNLAVLPLSKISSKDKIKSK
jgi:hypothetical protein